MSKTFEQTVDFDGATPQQLFESYLDSKTHGVIVGAPVEIDAQVGGQFSAFGGGLTGRFLELVSGRLIVQTWRGQPWKAQDLDSVLILGFYKKREHASIHLVHANVPDHAYALVNEGAWSEKYWEPWKQMLRSRARSRK